MVTDGQMIVWCGIWLAITAVLFLSRARLGIGAGLVTAYVLQLFMLHWLASAIYVLPWYWNLDPAVVLSGLQQSTYAIGAFTVGVIGMSGWLSGHSAKPAGMDGQPQAAPNVKLYMLVGIGSYSVLMPLFGEVPTLSAIVNGASSAVIVGLALACWNAANGPHKSYLWVWLAVAALLPFVTIAAQGFMGYGLAAAAVIFAFVGSFYRPLWKTVAIGIVGTYIGLSLYVTYMRDRNDIRTVVWGGESALARLTRLKETFSDFEPFDLYNVDHLQRIDLRLNQNYLVGEAVLNLQNHPELFAGGETILDAIKAPIPRALWPNKPMIAGSGNLVSRFTGERFAEGTSIGIGQVMELYVNYGETGVVVGFILFGALMCYVDRRVSSYRDDGNWQGFTMWFLPGLSLLQLGGSFVEITAGVGAAIIVARLLNRLSPKPHHPLISPAPTGELRARAARP